MTGRAESRDIRQRMAKTGESYNVARRAVAEERKGARCEFCAEPIIWCEWMPNPRARTVKGPQFVPVNAEPDDEHGVLAMTQRTGDRPLVGEMTRNQAAGYRDHGKHTYIQHAKTCAKADLLRRKMAARNR